MKIAICLLAYQPTRELLELYDGLYKGNTYSIYVVVDDNNYDTIELKRLFPDFHFIKVNEETCYKYGYTKLAFTVKKGEPSAWDKGIYYFCEENKINYDFNDYKNFNVYGCFQSVFKILPEFDLIIKKILDQDKKALILFVKDEYQVWYKILLKRWSVSIKNNLERIKFVDKLSEKDFINISGFSKVLLDPIFFGAGNSFIETFQHGTPMVTWPNNF